MWDHHLAITKGTALDFKKNCKSSWCVGIILVSFNELIFSQKHSDLLEPLKTVLLEETFFNEEQTFSLSKGQRWLCWWEKFVGFNLLQHPWWERAVYAGCSFQALPFLWQLLVPQGACRDLSKSLHESCLHAHPTAAASLSDHSPFPRDQTTSAVD